MSKKAAANMGWYINEGIDSFNDDKNRQNLIRKQILQEKREEKYRVFRDLMKSSKSYEKKIVLIRKKLDEERRKNNTITRELNNNMKKKYDDMKKKYDDIKKKYDVMKKKCDDIKDNEIKSYNKSRDVLCSRQDNICIICDKKMNNPSIEHLVPKSKGGSNELYNLAATCTECNNTRGTKPIENIKNLLIERVIEMEEFIKIVKEYIKRRIN